MEEKLTPEQFVYWLQGFIETSNPKSINKEQTKIIKDHLNLVFNKVTPINYIQPTIFGPTPTIPDPNYQIFC